MCEFRETEVDQKLPGAGGKGGNGKLLLNGYRVSV